VPSYLISGRGRRVEDVDASILEGGVGRGSFG